MSDDINDGGPAFPEAGMGGLPNGEFISGQAGMTLRDYFAAKALMGLLASVDSECDINKDISAKWAYEVADAMIAARGKK